MIKTNRRKDDVSEEPAGSDPVILFISESRLIFPPDIHRKKTKENQEFFFCLDPFDDKNQIYSLRFVCTFHQTHIHREVRFMLIHYNPVRTV